MPVRLKRCSGPCAQSYPITYFWSDAGAPDGRMSRCPTCEKNARRARAAERASGEVEGTPDRNGRLVHFSDEERRRRSQVAKRLHQEGRFGGAVIGRNGGRAVRRHRITDAVLEHFRQPDMQALVIRAYESNLRGKNKSARKQAADAIMRIEQEADKRLMAERGGGLDPNALTDEELVELVTQGVEAMIERGEIPVTADVELGEDSVREIS